MSSGRCSAALGDRQHKDHRCENKIRGGELVWHKASGIREFPREIHVPVRHRGVNHAKERERGEHEAIDDGLSQRAVDQARNERTPKHAGQDETIAESNNDLQFGQPFFDFADERGETVAAGSHWPSLIWRRRATVGKNENATAGACFLGEARKAWHMMSSATKMRIGARTARGMRSTIKPT